LFIQETNVAKPLTKSRFKLALECPTKLYYSNEKNGYFDKNEDNDFLQALADGGIQIGELAKFKYHKNPIDENITITTLKYDEAIAETKARLSKLGKVVIAEAAINYEKLFARVDILIRHQESKVIELIEVKSKSLSPEIIESQFKAKRTKSWIPNWLPYLYDIAFQTYLAKKEFPDFKIIPKLLLLDPSQLTDIDGLHQHFKIVYKFDPDFGKKRAFIETLPNLQSKDLGALEILLEVDVSDVVDELLNSEVLSSHAPPIAKVNLSTYIDWASEIQNNGTRHFEKISKTCKNCQYRADEDEIKLSGVHQCWSDQFNWSSDKKYNNMKNREKPLSIDLWGGGFGNVSVAQLVLDKHRAFLADIKPEDITPSNNDGDNSERMSAFQRRMAQIDACGPQGETYVLNENRLAEMDDWKWPLHMIDFETSAPAIPFFKGMAPYETLAFQFSHHIMEKDSSGKVKIRHATQWISTEANSFPSINFVRALRNALMPQGQLEGTVFRYHNHENSVLRKLRKLIDNLDQKIASDKTDLIEFIDLITKSSKGESAHEGSRQMVDLHRLVQEGYYSKHAGGSISLKYMLPAILHDASKLKGLYSQANIYGVNKKISSLNFNESIGHIWLDPAKGNNPYKTLPAIFPEGAEINEVLSRLAGGDDFEEGGGAIDQGGLAMTAYNYTQFTCLKIEERKLIESALLRYCELDTLAMVMLVQGVMELRGKTLELI